MNYQETIHYLYQKLPLFSNLGAKAYKADLKNTIALTKYLGNPQDKIKTIHIAGTNGKGSTSHMLSAVFQESGYQTGLYTSPHLKDFRERIRFNGEMVPKEFVEEFVEKIKKNSEEISPSFFELTFVMALQYFAEKKVDVAIIETGLGGRLDSTNIITPLLSVITNIGYDHMDILGNTLEKIAGEKAGIIKNGVPVVIGESLPETKMVFKEHAKRKNATIYFAEEIYHVLSSKNYNETFDAEIINTETKEKNNYELDLTGIYQLKNLVTVLESIDLLRNTFHLGEEKVKEALSHVKKLNHLHGRWEVINTKPLVILDVAHNIDGMRQLVDQISISSFKSLHIIFGMVKDKEIDKVLELLPAKATYYFTKAQIPRALPESELLAKAQKYNLRGNAFGEVNEALKAAMKAASDEDMILVCGSVFVVGEVTLNLKK
jgi:dihydrofolate synthase/folylpolyglutamate synthase